MTMQKDGEVHDTAVGTVPSPPKSCGACQTPSTIRAAALIWL
ncbi:MAG TPA: hypothetical protein VKU35_00955 [Candidatus Limnocylindria bacterium]|nr:hypothetical protein [Candidatus Limnocylindria bacterium]